MFGWVVVCVMWHVAVSILPGLPCQGHPEAPPGSGRPSQSAVGVFLFGRPMGVAGHGNPRIRGCSLERGVGGRLQQRLALSAFVGTGGGGDSWCACLRFAQGRGAGSLRGRVLRLDCLKLRTTPNLSGEGFGCNEEECLLRVDLGQDLGTRGTELLGRFGLGYPIGTSFFGGIPPNFCLPHPQGIHSSGIGTLRGNIRTARARRPIF